MEKVNVELVSPEAKILETAAVMVTVPSSEGDMGVMHAHSPVMSTLRNGVINIYANDMDTITDQLFVAGGFVDVSEEGCTILAEDAIPVSALNPDDIKADMDQLTADIKLVETDAERTRLNARLAVMVAKQDALLKSA